MLARRAGWGGGSFSIRVISGFDILVPRKICYVVVDQVRVHADVSVSLDSRLAHDI